MVASFITKENSKTIPITPIESTVFKAWLNKESKEIQSWVTATGFAANPQQMCFVGGRGGDLSRVLIGISKNEGLWDYSFLPKRLPKGSYKLDIRLSKRGATKAAIGWGLGGYSFDRYKTSKSCTLPSLVWPLFSEKKRAKAMIAAIQLVRNLINTPAENLGPSEFSSAARKVAKEFGAEISVIRGNDLLKKNYPTIHAVGRASDDPPRLIDIRWGHRKDPKVSIVGKGVCFDTGGLDLKPAAGMLRMKKDMGGGAHALGLARLIMELKLPVRLRVLIPAVENNISGNAFRPLDVIKTRKGITVEIGNTDAEGRLVMCDALTEADSEKPDIVVDFATLTGAARVALGTDLPAMFANDEGLANEIIEAGEAVGDPVWRLPLWRPYRELLQSQIADINNVSEGGFGGAITAALYLDEFVSDTTRWAHFDIMAWNVVDRPGRPVGGEAQSLRAVFEMLENRYR